MDLVARLTSQNLVVVFSMSSCCMCHAIKRLLIELGINSTVYELDEEPRGKEIERALLGLLGRTPAVPAVFIGGQLVGGADKVMALHLSGDLVKRAKPGVFWP